MEKKEGYMFDEQGGTGTEWNLATDFDGQTDEVKAFLGRLLGVI